jgi:hypothetical protein
MRYLAESRVGPAATQCKLTGGHAPLIFRRALGAAAPSVPALLAQQPPHLRQQRQQPPHRRARRAAKTPAAKANARGSDKGCGIGVNRRREIITGEFRSA